MIQNTGKQSGDADSGKGMRCLRHGRPHTEGDKGAADGVTPPTILAMGFGDCGWDREQARRYIAWGRVCIDRTAIAKTAGHGNSYHSERGIWDQL